MKTLLFIVGFFISISGFAQAKLGMSSFYTITPSSVTNPTVGATYGTLYTVHCAVQNKGNAVFSGNITLLRSINSGTFSSTNKTVFTQVLVNLNPNDTLGITFADSITPGNYRQSGNGNTVVVWPVSSGANTIDSLHTVPIYVTSLTGIQEFEKNVLMIYPNPVNRLLFIKPQEGIEYKEVKIYDMQERAILKIPFAENIDVSKLPAGLYRINISTDKEKEYTSLFMKQD